MKSVWHKLKNYWHRLPIEHRGAVIIAIPLVCLMGSVVTYTLLRQRMVEAQAYVEHTNQVLAKSQSTLISLLNAETGVRGYYISKKPLFLEPYQLARQQIGSDLKELEELVTDRPAQQQQARLLSQIAQAKLDHLQNVVRRVDESNGAAAPADINRLLAGKQVMDRFRSTIAKFEAEEYRLLDIRAAMLRDQQDFNATAMWYGIALSLVGTVLTVRLLRDLTKELRDREISLRESRSLIEAIVSNIVDGAIVVNPQGQIETFNPAAEQMFGYTAAEVLGWEWQRLLCQEDEATQKLLFYTPYALSQLTPTGQIMQAMGQRKNGEVFPLEVSMNNIELDDDRIAIFRDISARTQAAATLKAKAVEMAELNNSLIASNLSLSHSNRELDQFAYITSHDLKAPLRAVASLSEWIEEDLDAHISPETRSQMHLLRSRVYRMQSLLNSLLEYSRVGRVNTPVSTVDVHRLLAKVIDALAPPDTFTIKIATAMPTLTARQQPLEQVFSHLLDNAIRHHPTKVGIIEISAKDLGDRYEFAIADDGDGIEPQYQKRIYTIFQTLKARDLQENVGAGLAIVKKIVTAEGGTIELQSLAGKGAIFRFTWLKQPAILDKDNTTSQA
jgi:PAS domain S-box-containing protein